MNKNPGVQFYSTLFSLTAYLSQLKALTLNYVQSPASFARSTNTLAPTILTSHLYPYNKAGICSALCHYQDSSQSRLLNPKSFHTIPLLKIFN